MKINGSYKPESTICKWRWSYPVVMVDTGQVRTCDKTINIQLSENDFQKYGTDAFINNPTLLERRKEKLNGLRHSDCFSCITLEDKGLVSSRTGEKPFVEWMNTQTGKNNSFEDYKFKDDPELLRSDKPDILEISLSNQCNLKCIYCSDEYSTEWERENIKFGDKKPDMTHKKRNLKPKSFDMFFWKWFKEIVPTLKRIIFIGGEPLVNQNFLEYLEKINQMCPKSSNIYDKPIIQIISNFGIPNKKFEKVLDVIDKLTENYIVHLEVSGETVGNQTEYIRTGLKWNILERNVHSTLSRRFSNFRFGLQLAVNNLCISNMHELFKWAWDLQVQYNTFIDYKENIVVSPGYLSPYLLDESFITYVDKCIKFVKDKLANPDAGIFVDTAFGQKSHERWKEYLPFMYSIRKGISENNEDKDAELNFYIFTEKIEERRNMKFLEYFPEYADFYYKCESRLTGRLRVKPELVITNNTTVEKKYKETVLEASSNISKDFQRKHIKVFNKDGFAYQGVEEIISKNLNNTKGWKCTAGIKNLYIDYDGNVFVCNNASSKLNRFNDSGWAEEIDLIEKKFGIRIDTKENIDNGTFSKYLKKYNLKAGSFEKVLDPDSSKDKEENWGFLGNISKGFEINQNVLDCPYETCGCGADIPILKARNTATLNQITNPDIIEDMDQLNNKSIDFIDSMQSNNAPFSTILWDLGRRCNYDCSYCWPGVHNAREPHKDINVLINTCKKIISKLAPGDKKLFCFSGGEPTLHPNILELLSNLRKQNQEVLITSNGSMKHEKWKKLVENIDRLQLSAHFEFLDDNKFTNNLIIFMDEQLRALNEENKSKSVDVKLMTPPGGVKRSSELRKEVLKIMDQEKYKVLKERRLIGISNVPLRGIDDSEKMLQYKEEELEFFKLQKDF